MMNHLRTVACAGLMLSSVCHGQTITNGSMTGPVVIGSPPPGWASVNADGDTIGPGGFSGWATGMPASNDGGTFLMVLDNGSGGAFDRCGQVVTGFQPGEMYTIGFEYGNGALPSFGGYAGPLRVEMEVFGTTYLTPEIAFDGIGLQRWFDASFSFMATATSTTVYFRAISTQFGSGAAATIDGVYLVPSPGTLALLVLPGIAAVRRRR